MPVYEYRCRRCGQEFEIRSSISEYARGLDAACPHCGSKECERVISVAAILGGSGTNAEKDSGQGGPPSCSCGS